MHFLYYLSVHCCRWQLTSSESQPHIPFDFNTYPTFESSKNAKIFKSLNVVTHGFIRDNLLCPQKYFSFTSLCFFLLFISSFISLFLFSSRIFFFWYIISLSKIARQKIHDAERYFISIFISDVQEKKMTSDTKM